MFDNKLSLNLSNYNLTDCDGISIKNGIYDSLKNRCFNHLEQDEENFIIVLNDEIKNVISDYEIILDAIRPYKYDRRTLKC